MDHHNFPDDNQTADNFIKMVADIVFDHVEYLSPRPTRTWIIVLQPQSWERVTRPSTGNSCSKK